MNPKKLFLTVLPWISLVQGSGQPKKASSSKGEEKPTEISTLSSENICASYFDLEGNWEMNYPFILQRERGLTECREWKLEEVIQQKIKLDAAIESDTDLCPVEIEESVPEKQENPSNAKIVLENQENPSNSVIGTIMAQYRRDLGFSPVESFHEPQASSSEVLGFVSCLTQEPAEFDDSEESENETKTVSNLKETTEEQKRIKRNMLDYKKHMKKFRAELRADKKKEKFNQIIEAYSFLKYLGIITGQSDCEEFSESTGVTSVYEFKKYYQDELRMYTFLNWDFLDLTPFEFHKFPIVNQITRNVTISGHIQNISPPVMMPKSIAILKKYLKQIRFHNPRTLEGRRMLLFQRLYRRYLKAVGKGGADKTYIDWSHCVAGNWPDEISQIDMDRWSNNDIELLNNSLDSRQLVFEKASRQSTRFAKKLGEKDSHSTPVKYDISSIEENDCALSDDEIICGPGLSDASIEVMENILAVRAVESAEAKIKYESLRNTGSQSRSERKELKKASASSKPNPSSSSSHSTIFKSYNPADPIKRAQIVAKALNIYRRCSGQPNADQIDWSSANLSVLQNHILPFSPDLETEADVENLEKLITVHKRLTFYNLNVNKGRITRAYIQLYKKYAKAVGPAAHEYFIKWRDVVISGFPEGVSFEHSRWKTADIEKIESSMDNIRFYAKSDNNSDSQSSSCASINSENNEHIEPSIGIINNYFVETVGLLPLLETPHYSDYASAELNGNKKCEVKRKRATEVRIRDQTIEKRILDPVNGFGDLTPQQLNILTRRLHGILDSFLAARDSPSTNDRLRRVYSEIIRGFNLLLDHTNDECSAPLVSVQDILDFISFCRICLLRVQADGSMDEEILRDFVVRSIRLRALLNGSRPLSDKDRHKRSNITKSMISATDASEKRRTGRQSSRRIPIQPVADLPKLAESGKKREMSDSLIENTATDEADAHERVSMAELERLRHHSERNIMVKIMKKYRQDLGLAVNEDFVDDEIYTKDELIAQLTPLFSCFDQDISASSPENLVNAMDALKFLSQIGEIPRDLSCITPELCLKFRSNFTDVKGFCDYNQKRLDAYTRPNWDYLDLTHFEYQMFPIIGKIVKTFPAQQCYERKGVFSVSGMELLKKYFAHIRFHNPHSLEGLRMIVFQKLYHYYFKAVKQDLAHPNFIDWTHCNVEGWPEDMSRIDLGSWTEDQTKNLIKLIKANRIKFTKSKKSHMGAGVLGNVPSFNQDRVIAVDDNLKYECTLSDSETAAGLELKDVVDNRRMERNLMISEDKREAERKLKVPDLKIVRNKRRAKIISKPEEEEWSDESDLPDSSKKQWPRSRAAPKSKSSPKNKPPVLPRKILIKTNDHPGGLEIACDPPIKRIPNSERIIILKNAARLYREDTGETGDIDWSTIQLIKFNHHNVPFSTGLETDYDLKVLKNLIKHHALAFINPANSAEDFKIRVYERLYRIYEGACGIYANPFDVYLEDMDMEGWPEGVGENLDAWTYAEVVRINEAINSGEIVMKPNERFQREIDDTNASIQSELPKELEKPSDSPEICLNLFSDSASDEPRISIIPNMQLEHDFPNTDDSSLLTPGYETYIGKKRVLDINKEDSTPTKKISGVSESIDEKSQELIAINPSDIVPTGEFQGVTFSNLSQMRMKITCFVSQFEILRAAYDNATRHYHIYTLLLDTFQILLQHIDAFSAAAIPPQISVDEATDYLQIFNQSLLAISAEGSMELPHLRRYVVAAVCLRARLAGGPLVASGSAGRRDVSIMKSNIVDTQNFSFLSKKNSSWPVKDLELVEFYLISGISLFTF